MVQEILPNCIYTIPVRLINSPLKNLNSYIIKGKERNLIIDLGFNQKECLEDMSNGLRELDIDINKTDIFLTHHHSDHTGLTPVIASPNSKIYMGTNDIPIFYNFAVRDKVYLDAVKDLAIKNGFPEEEYQLSLKKNPGRAYSSPEKFDCIPVNDGDTITVDSIELKCVLTAGHSPGHTSLYNEKNKIMFLGDHVLFDITPNITLRPYQVNPLLDYMENLEKIKKYDVEKPLPAHRKSGASLNKRVDELIQHHKTRLQEIIDIIGSSPDITGYDVASRMHWSIKAKNWGEFPIGQKWFATSEANAHLNYLVKNGSLNYKTIDGIYRYYLN